MLHCNNRFLASLGDEIDTVAGGLSVVKLTRGQILCEPGEAIARVYFPLSGAISKMAVFEDGAEIECLLIGREGVVGAISTLGFRVAFTRDVCHVNGSAASIDAGVLYEACQRSVRLRAAFQRYCGWKMGCAIRNGACNGRHNVEQRLCRWLLTYSDVLESCEAQLSQETLAGILGAQRTSINPTLQRLQADGSIAVGRARVTILNRPFLMARACECYAMSKTSQEELEPPRHLLRAVEF